MGTRLQRAWGLGTACSLPSSRKSDDRRAPEGHHASARITKGIPAIWREILMRGSARPRARAQARVRPRSLTDSRRYASTPPRHPEWVSTRLAFDVSDGSADRVSLCVGSKAVAAHVSCTCVASVHAPWPLVFPRIRPRASGPPMYPIPSPFLSALTLQLSWLAPRMARHHASSRAAAATHHFAVVRSLAVSLAAPPVA